jgi:hypothetical protein
MNTLVSNENTTSVVDDAYQFVQKNKCDAKDSQSKL